MKLIKIMAGLLATAALLAGVAVAQTPEKKRVTLGVGGKPALYYLPLTLCERLGFFTTQGVDVDINDFPGGAKSLQALVGGSVDVVTGAYEHTLRMQQMGQDIRAVIELGRYPAITLGIKADKAANFKSLADLKGMKIGVTAPGSSTNMVVWYLMAKAGLARDDASFIGVGTGPSAVAAIKRGEIDAISNIDPVIAKLEADKDIVIVAETRTTEGTNKVFGGPMPAAVLYMRKDFIDKYPNTTQALVNALYKTLKWMEKATPEQIVGVVPEEYLLGDRSVYLSAVKASLPAYSKDGVVSEDGQKRSLEFLRQFEAEFRDANFDLARTWDGRFVKKAAELIE